MSAVPEDNNESVGSTSSTHEFIIECKNGERIYVPSMQGKLIKSRCHHFRVSLGSSADGITFVVGSDSDGITKEQQEKSKNGNRILTKETWSSRTARHIIELLTEGTTWIENNHRRFVELSRACEEINVSLCLGSPINYHDILDRASSLRFFQLIDDQKYQFKLVGTIKSWQWIHLLQNGILLLLKSKVLMLSVPKHGQLSSNVVASIPKLQRLSKCDDLHSEFSVYSERSKINTLYTILNILSSNKTESNTDKALSQNLLADGRNREEFIKIIYKTRVSGLEEQDLNMLWRMTHVSYTLSTAEEQSLLQSDEIISTSVYQCMDLPLGDVQICEDSVTDTSTSSTSSETTDRESIGETSHASHDTPIYSPPSTHSTLSAAAAAASSRSSKYESRTITGTSFMVLKHLFDDLNHSEKSLSAEHSDPSLLPACLIISNPTPDTLGRFLNASAKLSSNADVSTSEIGYDIVSSPLSTNGINNTIFYVSNTSQHVKGILDYMSDYSKTSVVGEADFRLKQRRHVSV